MISFHILRFVLDHELKLDSVLIPGSVYHYQPLETSKWFLYNKLILYTFTNNYRCLRHVSQYYGTHIRRRLPSSETLFLLIILSCKVVLEKRPSSRSATCISKLVDFLNFYWMCILFVQRVAAQFLMFGMEAKA